MAKWFMPKGKTIWVLFDTNNGDVDGTRYCHWFCSRAKAMEYRRYVHSNPDWVRLSMPVRFKRAA